MSKVFRVNIVNSMESKKLLLKKKLSFSTQDVSNAVEAEKGGS